VLPVMAYETRAFYFEVHHTNAYLEADLVAQ
jgi:hypothetical protein